MKTTLLLTALLAVPLAHAHGDKKSMPVEETVSEQTDWGIAGSVEVACLVAGHYLAGMRGTITVTPTQGDAK